MMISIRKTTALLLLLSLLLCTFAACGDTQNGTTPPANEGSPSVTAPIDALCEKLRAAQSYEMIFRFSAAAYENPSFTLKRDGAKTYMEDAEGKLKQYTETVDDLLYLYTQTEDGWQKECHAAESAKDPLSAADFSILFGAKNYTAAPNDASLYLLQSGKEPSGMQNVSLRIIDGGCVIKAQTVQNGSTMETEITVQGIGKTTVTLPSLP